MPKKILLFAVFMVFCAPSTYAQNQDRAEEQPQAQEEYSWNFGQVKAQAVVKHEFILENKSTQILQIKDISTSCGCTVSKVKKKTLVPGEKTIIEVRFNSKGYSGKVRQFVYVATDSPDEPILRFTIQADVIK